MKERILTRAQEIFTQEGYTRLNMDSLARDLGISKKTIYEHYSSKKELFEEVVKSIYEMKFQRMQKIMNEMTVNDNFNLIENLPKVWKMIEDFTRNFTPVLMDDIQKYAHHLQNYCQSQDSIIKTHMDKSFALGKKQGYIKENINPDLYRIIMMGALHNVLKPEVLGTLPLTAEECLRIVYEILHTGILSEKGRKDYNELILSNK